MIEYKLESGKLVKVKPEHEQQFLQKYPTATLVSGNQESPAGGAPTGQETAAPVQEVVQPQNNTDSNLEVGSLESLSKGVTNSYSELENTNSKLEKLKSAMGDAQAFNNEVLYKSLSEEYNNTISVNEDNRVKYKNVAKQYKDLYRAEEAKKVKENKEATEEEANKLGHGFLSPLIHLARGFTSFAQGIGSITEGVETGVLEWWDEADLGFLKEPGEEWTTEKRKKARLAVKAERLATGLVNAAQGRGNLISNALFSSQMAAPAMAALDAEIPEFDTNITQDFSNGDYLKAAHRTVDGFFASAPSFIAAMIPGGLALLAASTAGNKYEEEVLANPDMDTGTLLVNATGSGLIEAGFEYVTRGLLKKTGLIQTGGVAAAREYLEYSSKHILKKFGLAGWSMVKEGSSEAATELTSALWDSIPKDKGGLGKEMEFNDVFYRMSDAFIIGSFSGGVFESVGAMNSGSSKKNAEAVLMSEELKSVVSISSKKISELTADLDEATPEEKELIQEQIKAEAERIKSIHGRNSKILSTLKGKALRDYADNVDKINRVKKAHKEAKTDTGKELALNKYNQLTEANDIILKESIQSYTENSVSNMQEMASKLSESGGPSGTITTKTAAEIEAMDMGFDKDENGNTVLDKDGNKVKKSTIASKQYGTIIQQADGSYEIVINKDVPAIGVAGHEFFHAILFNTLGKDPKVAKALQEALDGHVNSLGGNQTAMRERLNESYEGSEDLSEETITIMSESILNGSLEYNEGFFTKIGDILRRFLQGKGIPGQDIKLDTGKDVFNFIKDFVHSVETGKVNKAIIKAGAKGAEGKLVDKAKAETKTEASNKDNKDSKTETKTKYSKSDAKIPIDKLGKVDSDGSDMTEAGVGNFLYQAEADQVVSKIKEEGYLDNLIAAQYKVRPVPGDFVQDVLAELTPHIKRFNPEVNDSLFGWIQGQLANKAGNVYNEIYKNKGPAKTVDVDGVTSDGAPLVQIEADVSADMLRIDEIGLDSTEVEQRSKLRRSMRLDGKMMQTVKDAVMKTFGTKLPDVNSKDFRKALEKAFRTELKKPLQDLMGTRSDFNLFLKNHYKAIIKALPVETLVQMERNLKPEHRIFTESRRITKPTEVDKLISQDKLPKDTSRTSGPQLHTKKEIPSVSKVMAYFRGENMEETLGYKVGGSTLGTRKDKLAMELGVELAFDATSEVLQDPSVQEKRQGILELQGIKQTANELAVIAKQIDRDPSVKFSKKSSYLFDNANLPSGKLMSNRGIMTPLIYRTVKRLSGRKGEVDVKLADFDREIIIQQVGKEAREGGGLTSVGAQINRILETFSKLDPAYIVLFRTGMSNGQGNSLFGLSSVFDKISNGLEYIKPNFVKRHAFNKNKKLSSGHVIQGSNKEVLHVVGREKMTGEEFVKFDGQKLDLLVKLYVDIQKHLETHPQDAWFFSRLITDASSNGNSIHRMAASLVGVPKDINGNLIYNETVIEEHMLPQNNVGTMLFAAALDNSVVKVKDIAKLLRATFAQVSLLATEDILLKQAGYQSKMPDTFWSKVVPRIMDGKLDWLGRGMGSVIRYSESGVNLNNYLVPSLGVGVTIADHFMVGVDTSKMSASAISAIVQKQNKLISDILTGDITREKAKEQMVSYSKSNPLVGPIEVNNRNLVAKALENRIKYSKSGEAKGMSTFDFDETLIIDGDNSIIATDPSSGQQIKISSGDWPVKGPDLAAEGFEFDFSDFANVRGGKEGPLLQKMKNQIKKYGSKNVFVLTARQQASATPIQQWLKAKGIDIAIENITGLGKSEGSAKGEWMLQKFAEGYNDMYFVDDAMSNVDAVREVLDALDIKSKVVQAKIKFSKTGSIQFNEMVDKVSQAKFADDIAKTKAGIIYSVPNKSGKPQTDRKVIFLAGGAGSGKSGVVKSLGLETQGYKIVNQDISLEWLKNNAGLPTDMRDLTQEQMSELGKLAGEARRIAKRKQAKFKGRGNGVVIDGTGGSINVMRKKVQEFKDAGYDVQMLFVDTSVDVALDRNANRKERSLSTMIVKKNHQAVQGNKAGFIELFGENFAEVNTDKLGLGAKMPKDLTGKMDKFTNGQTRGRLDATEFATKGKELKDQGATFDFSEFNIDEGDNGRVKFSKTVSKDFNKMLEINKGIKADQTFSAAEATLRGAKQGMFKFFVPPSAEDFKGLIYSFLGKGKQGNQDLAWFKENLFDPFAKGVRELNSVKQRMTEEYTALKKGYPAVIKSLNDKVGGTDFSVDNAIRVYLWNMAGFEVPGISKAQKEMLLDHVSKNAELVAFAEILSNISRRSEGYTKPKDYWVTQSIASDLVTIVHKVNRNDYLAEWIENKNLIFSKENLNKIESIYGTNFREQLENTIYRMETGSNRPSGKDGDVNRFVNWINGAVGAVMFFNTRSALLQTLSIVNFLNFENNNIFAAARAFKNQKQFWSDFTELYNSDMLKQRRAGLKIDVSASELAEASAQGKNKAEAVIGYLLQKGFTPTQIADSFAISMGGATFYRNNINRYLKDGMSQAEAESQAFLDFQEIAEETQQSSRPDLVSNQQAGILGRLILAWANTPMQYTRLTKKALSDLVNGRGDAKSHISRIIYYGAIQNIIFGALQTGLMFTMFGDDEDDENAKKEVRVLNGWLDTLLRGTGVYGAAVSTIKNTLMAAHEELGKGYGRKDYSRIVQQLISLSPPISSKVRKIISAIKTYDYNKDIISSMGMGISNPAWNVFTNVVEGVTNIPVARVMNKLQNLEMATTGNMEFWQRLALTLGWSRWSIGVEDEKRNEAKADAKKDRKEKKKKAKADKRADDESKKVRCSAIKSSGSRCNMKVTTNAKTAKCIYHKKFKEGSDTDGDGKKEYRCKASTSSGKRCGNKTENKNKKCYAHQ
mgnify:CR=1 FL=1